MMSSSGVKYSGSEVILQSSLQMGVALGAAIKRTCDEKTESAMYEMGSTLKKTARKHRI